METVEAISHAPIFLKCLKLCALSFIIIIIIINYYIYIQFFRHAIGKCDDWKCSIMRQYGFRVLQEIALSLVRLDCSSFENNNKYKFFCSLCYSI